MQSDAGIRSCLTHTAVYTAPETLRESSNPTATINKCIDDLRSLQASSPRLNIIEGIYATSPSSTTISCAERQSNISHARGTVAEGYSFYQLPDDSECPGQYDALGDLMTSPSDFVSW